MALRMVSLKSSKTGEWIARKGIPADVRAEYKRLYGVGHEAILRVPAGTSKAQAKAQLGQWQAEVETQIERIRASAKGEGEPLTKLNALALAGRWYLWFVARHESDPGSPENWADRKEHLTERVWYPHAPVEHLEDPNADESWPWTQWPEVREAVRPEVAEMALAATFLASEGKALTTDASILFIDAVSQRLFTAYAVLEQRAKGDYSRDTYPDTFPAYVDQRRGMSTGMSCWDLFGAYVEATKPKAGTVNRWRAVFKSLQAMFPASSAGALTEDDARAWKDKGVDKDTIDGMTYAKALGKMSADDDAGETWEYETWKQKEADKIVKKIEAAGIGFMLRKDHEIAALVLQRVDANLVHTLVGEWLWRPENEEWADEFIADRQERLELEALKGPGEAVKF